jgi:uncharacterized damage-inducible protein DinB
MITLQKANIEILEQLKFVLNQLNKNDFKKPLALLNNISIGQHCRHIVEFYQCLMQGLEGEVVDYDARMRDLRIETDLIYCLEMLNNNIDKLKSQLTDQSVLLKISFDKNETFSVSSTFLRELIYIIEHTIHHLAIINIGVRNTFEAIVIPPNFGVAYSTILHNEKSHLTA